MLSPLIPAAPTPWIRVLPVPLVRGPMPRRCPECELARPRQRPSAPRSQGGRILAADGCASSSGNPACCFCGAWAAGGPREWRSLWSSSHWFGHAHLPNWGRCVTACLCADLYVAVGDKIARSASPFLCRMRRSPIRSDSFIW